MTQPGTVNQSVRRVRGSVAAILTLAAVVALGAPKLFGGNSVEISFKFKRASVTLHEPVFMEFSVRNTLPGTISLDLGLDRTRNLVFSVTCPDGTVRSKLQLVGGGIGFSGALSLPPGQVYSQELLLNQWWQFPVQGTYLVKAEFTGPIRTQLGQPVQADRSAEMELNIEPRDPNRLAQLCRTLAGRAESGNAGTALSAGKILSYVIDPVAVPYLADVLRNSDFARNSAVQGLGRIRTSEALSILRSNLNIEDPALKAAIERALDGTSGSVMD
jgi:hypothetical protein